MKRTALLAVLALVGSTALAFAERPETDEPRVCIDVRDIRSRRAISDQEIRFEMDDGSVWVNRLKRPCPNLRFENAFAWDVTGGTVCANAQTIYVLNSGNACQLGEFTPAEPER
jgi:hypothetical protein